MSVQLGFFGDGARRILDDATGQITYYPAVLSFEQQQRLFARLLDVMPWRSERRMMYEREVDVPRLVAKADIEELLPDELARAVPVVERLVGTRFTSIGMNLYRDGNDSVAPHNDKIRELIADRPIALLSLGSARRMTIRSKSVPRRVLDLDLEPGSVLVMSYQTQFTYDHGIPKTTAKVGPRISLAFRVRPPRNAS